MALQIYDPTALNRPKEAERAARIIAEDDPSPQAYLRLVQYATLAGDTRTADLAGEKAIDLAPKAQRKEAEQAGQAGQAAPAAGRLGRGPDARARTGRLSALRLCARLRHRTRGEK